MTASYVVFKMGFCYVSFEDSAFQIEKFALEITNNWLYFNGLPAGKGNSHICCNKESCLFWASFTEEYKYSRASGDESTLHLPKLTACKYSISTPDFIVLL